MNPSESTVIPESFPGFVSTIDVSLKRLAFVSFISVFTVYMFGMSVFLNVFAFYVLAMTGVSRNFFTPVKSTSLLSELKMS